MTTATLSVLISYTEQQNGPSQTAAKDRKLSSFDRPAALKVDSKYLYLSSGGQQNAEASIEIFQSTSPLLVQ